MRPMMATGPFDFSRGRRHHADNENGPFMRRHPEMPVGQTSDVKGEPSRCDVPSVIPLLGPHILCSIEMSFRTERSHEYVKPTLAHLSGKRSVGGPADQHSVPLGNDACCMVTVFSPKLANPALLSMSAICSHERVSVAYLRALYDGSIGLTSEVELSLAKVDASHRVPVVSPKLFCPRGSPCVVE